MKNMIKMILMISFLMIGFQNCSLNQSNSNNSNQNNQQTTKDAKLNPYKINTVKYFRGGWFGPPPNWSNSLELKYSSDGIISIQSDTHDQLCFKSLFSFNENQKKEFETLFSQLNVYTNNDLSGELADGGVDQITVTYLDNKVETIHLVNISNQPGILIAAEGKNLSAFLQKLDNELPMACQ